MDLLGWDKEKILELVRQVIEYEHLYYCEIDKMDRAHMFPEEIMTHICCLLESRPEMAFKNISTEKEKLEAIKKHPKVL